MQVSNPPDIPQQPISDKYFPTRHFFLTPAPFPAAPAAKTVVICCEPNSVNDSKHG